MHTPLSKIDRYTLLQFGITSFIVLLDICYMLKIFFKSVNLENILNTWCVLYSAIRNAIEDPNSSNIITKKIWSFFHFFNLQFLYTIFNNILKIRLALKERKIIEKKM